jgi:hypothetical protein
MDLFTDLLLNQLTDRRFKTSPDEYKKLFHKLHLPKIAEDWDSDYSFAKWRIQGSSVAAIRFESKPLFFLLFNCS